jgi:DNA-binding CsgD family transcriptional regulator
LATSAATPKSSSLRVSRAADRVWEAWSITASPGVPVLTPREQQILALWRMASAISRSPDVLAISTNTVKTHLELLFDKLEVSSRTEAVTAAARMGLLFL